jgi:NADH-quinone oxidoreductase subunit N
MEALISLFITAVIVLFAGLKRQTSLAQPLTLIGLVGTLLICGLGWALPAETAFSTMFVFNKYAWVFTGIATFATLLIVLLSGYGFRHITDTLSEHYGLILFSLCGVACMVSFENMVMLFLGIEILSIPLYVLAGSERENLKSNEAALKYFLMGSFATGILLFGIALIFGATGHFDLTGIRTAIMDKKVFSMPMLHVGVLIMMAGMSFKISAAPFHFWSPDVYDGSPNLVTAFMLTVVKTAAFAAFFRLFVVGFGDMSPFWSHSLAVIAALTMTIGNISAVFQTHFKRMLAYSSISHAGYLLLALLGGAQGGGALLVYTIAYSVATISAFAVYILVNEREDNATYKAFDGLAKEKPLAAFVMALSMISLAGIPITAGFFGKYFLFVNAFDHTPALILIAVINSAISISYYFRPIIAMYFHDKGHGHTHEQPLVFPSTYKWVMIVGAVIILGLCLVPSQLLSWVG